MTFENIVLNGTKEDLMERIPPLLDFLQILEQKDVGTIYEAPEALSDRMSGRPEVQLVFRQDSDFKKGTNQPGYHGRNRRKGQISFRLMNETSETLSKAELTRIGARIKELFGANNGYIWEKGKELYSYSDWTKGYHFQLLCRNETYAKDLITKVLSIQNHTPDWKLLFKNENNVPSARYPENPGTKVILGETVELKKYRSLVEVRFEQAVAHIKERISPVILYDRRGKRANALVS